MPKSRLRLSCACTLLSAVLCSLAVAQELNPGHKELLVNSLRIEKRITEKQRLLLSSATQNRFALAHQVLEVEPGLMKLRIAPTTARAQNKPHNRTDDGIEMVPISSPPFDYTLSRGGGFSQSDTSTAWCGRNVVTGYNDSSAILMTLNAASGGLSFSGVAHSEDGGKTFTDLGYLDPGPSAFNFLVGNPAVVCANEQRFYYASMFSTTVQISPTRLAFKEAIGINISDDGGRTWSTPIAAVLRDPVHILERESLAIDPSNPQRLFVTFTDIDFATATAGPCIGQNQMLIEMVRSTDGGQSWSKPQAVKRICGNTGNAVNGSRVAVGPAGEVYVTYLFYDNINGREVIQVRRSDNHGVTFRKEVDVTTVVPAGADSMLQGLFLSNEYPSLAVDLSKGESRGSLYLAWTDGRNHSQLDLFSASGAYNFGDVLLARSDDQGQHWSTPVGVSPAANGANRDQFLPWVAVDFTGEVAVCYSDRRNDPQNNAIDHYCSVSKDRGSTFQDLRLTDSNWSTGHSNDMVLQPYYMETYDGVSPDWTGHNGGFFSAFQFQNYGNPNAYGVRLAHE
ncbi:MAG: glycoside hydrolase [Acidobacteriia bacterium]|nr:glycoside hydrolase [Terriglobia bacterium]